MNAAAGPSGPLEIVVVALAAIAVAGAIVQAVRLTLRPGEESPDHVKRRVLEDDD